jgi:hypothetical protein
VSLGSGTIYIVTSQWNFPDSVCHRPSSGMEARSLDSPPPLCSTPSGLGFGALLPQGRFAPWALLFDPVGMGSVPLGPRAVEADIVVRSRRSLFSETSALKNRSHSPPPESKSAFFPIPKGSNSRAQGAKRPWGRSAPNPNPEGVEHCGGDGIRKASPNTGQTQISVDVLAATEQLGFENPRYYPLTTSALRRRRRLPESGS